MSGDGAIATEAEGVTIARQEVLSHARARRWRQLPGLLTLQQRGGSASAPSFPLGATFTAEAVPGVSLPEVLLFRRTMLLCMRVVFGRRSLANTGQSFLYGEVAARVLSYLPSTVERTPIGPTSPKPGRKRAREPTAVGETQQTSSASLPPVSSQPDAGDITLSQPAVETGASKITPTQAPLDSAEQPLFFLSAPADTAWVFVRLVTSSKQTTAYGGEELNRYFNRYGFISCVSLTKTTKPAASASGAFRCQDYIVELDSTLNCDAAVAEIAHPEVLFLAYHDHSDFDVVGSKSSSNSKNTHFASDIPSVDLLILSTLGNLCTPGADEPNANVPIGSATRNSGAEGAEVELTGHVGPAPSASLLHGSPRNLLTDLKIGPLTAKLEPTSTSAQATSLGAGMKSPMATFEMLPPQLDGVGSQLLGRENSDYQTPLRQRSTQLDDADKVPHDGLHAQTMRLIDRVLSYHRLLATHGRLSDITTGAQQDEFVPDIVVDNVPWWITKDQLLEYCKGFGNVAELQLAVSDRCGAFLGCARVLMESVTDAVRLEEGLNALEVEGYNLLAGIVVPEGHLVSLKDGSKVLLHSSEADPTGGGKPVLPPQGGVHREQQLGIFTQYRRWL